MEIDRPKQSRPAKLDWYEIYLENLEDSRESLDLFFNNVAFKLDLNCDIYYDVTDQDPAQFISQDTQSFDTSLQSFIESNPGQYNAQDSDEISLCYRSFGSELSSAINCLNYSGEV